MILPSGPVRVYVATKPVDFRKGIDGLAALAEAELRLDPFSGVVLVFRAKRADRIKILVWDGSGMVLIAKRLEAGKFAWPAMTDGVMKLSPAQLSALFRKFYDIAEAGHAPIAEEALRRIAAIYTVEAELRGQDPDTRRAGRRERSKPLVDDLRPWLEGQLVRLSGRSRLAEAIRYMLKLWDGSCACVCLPRW